MDHGIGCVCEVRDVEGGLRATGVEAPRGTRSGHRVVLDPYGDANLVELVPVGG